MAETPITPSVAVEPQVEKPSRIKSFTVNHPRTAKLMGIVALTAGVLTVVNVVKNKNRVDDSPELRDPNAPIDTSSETA